MADSPNVTADMNSPEMRHDPQHRRAQDPVDHAWDMNLETDETATATTKIKSDDYNQVQRPRSRQSCMHEFTAASACVDVLSRGKKSAVS